MRTIIAGSRTITDPKILEEAIKASGFTITEVVCGGAKGVDTLGKQWAEEHNIPVKMFPADWTTHGKAAGPIRNAEMAAYAEQAILIFDVQAENRGTTDMGKKCISKGILAYHHPANHKKSPYGEFPPRTTTKTIKMAVRDLVNQFNQASYRPPNEADMKELEKMARDCWEILTGFRNI